MANNLVTEIKLCPGVEIQRIKDGRYYMVLLDGIIVALCPTLETSLTVGRALKQAYTVYE